MNTLTLSGRATLEAMLLPLLFIVMWSSGYVVGKLRLPYASPFTLLFLRFGSAALILLTVAWMTGAKWPKTQVAYLHLLVVGILVQALQFSGLYSGLKLGVTAGVSALIVGMMPIFTALGASFFLNEKVSPRQWMGLAVGIFGVALVVSSKFGEGGASLTGYLSVVIALLGITVGTLYQKKYCVGLDLRVAGFVQLAVASVIAFFLADHFEGLAVEWTGQLVFASVWLSVVNSIGAVSLLFILMRKGEASKVASLFYLVPGVTALMGYVVLNETLNPTVFLGFFITAAAVYVCTRS
jgi:drug/metabolite transporter (DMT)-like permease